MPHGYSRQTPLSAVWGRRHDGGVGPSTTRRPLRRSDKKGSCDPRQELKIETVWRGSLPVTRSLFVTLIPGDSITKRKVIHSVLVFPRQEETFMRFSKSRLWMLSGDNSFRSAWFTERVKGQTVALVDRSVGRGVEKEVEGMMKNVFSTCWYQPARAISICSVWDVPVALGTINTLHRQSGPYSAHHTL